MMPFSPEFLKEIKAQAGPAETGKKDGLVRTASTVSLSSKNVDISPLEPLEGQDRMFHAYKLSESCSLIGCEDDTFNFFLSGFCHIVALKGDVCINGYTVPVSSDKHRVCNPIWQPAYPVCNISATVASTSASSFKTPSKQSGGVQRSHIESYLESFNITCSGASVGKFKGSTKTSNLFGEFNVVFAVEGMSPSQQEWLVAAEDQSMYRESATSTASKPDNRGIITVHTTPAISLKKASIVRVGSAMVGNYAGMTTARADCMTVPPSWNSACDKLTSQFAGFQSMNVAICGAKGVGKSTCLRYVVNKLLSVGEGLMGPRAGSNRLSIGGVGGVYASKKNTVSENQSGVSLWASRPSVCVLDCDLGQPELSVPGSVTLHVVSCTEDASGSAVGAFLSAPHLNMQTPERSYFLGDLTSKNEPQLVLRYVELLLQRYQDIVAEVAAAQEQARKAATKKFVQSNAFNALMLDADSDASSESEDDTAVKPAPSSSTSNTTLPPIPLVINLDGYVKNMGAEVLEGILRMADPSHVVHICSDRDRSLLPLESILNVTGAQDTECVDPPQTLPTKSPGPSSKNVALTSEGVDVEKTREKECEVLVVEPGRFYTTPRLAAVDLRSLRLVSYFLRTDTGVRPHVRDSSQQGTLVRSGSAGNIQQRSGSAGNLAALDGPVVLSDSISLRNGSVSHPQGLLALRLLSHAPYAIPFSSVSLCCLPTAGDLSARLVLAAMNASVVGIVTYSDKESKRGAENDADSDALRDLHVLGKKRLRLGEQEFDLSCPTNYPIAHCVGLGVVRAVDIPNQRIILTTPVAESLLLAPNTRLCLIKGGALQLPPSLSYAPTFPCFPYMSSESTGEGSAQLRTRNNVKRRGQQ